MCHVVVAIPTFRRPRGLAELLEAIASIPKKIRVVVADNDADKAEGATVVEGLIASGAYPHPLEVIRVSERGIATVRNALIARAISHAATRFVAMIDDDERPEPGWLESLLAIQVKTGAHVVGGPVLREFEVAVPPHVAGANYQASGKRASGRVDFVDATSNVLFEAAIFRERPSPWFDPFFGLTGGEDKDLMMALKLSGKTFAWADEARVSETLPASRCSAAWALQRAFSTGNSDMLINLRRRPPGFNAATETAKIVAALAVALVDLSVLSFSPARRFEGRRLGARVAGKLTALFGHRHLEYKTTHGG